MGLIARLLDLHRVPTSEVETLRRKVRRKERLAAAAKRHAATIAFVPYNLITRLLTPLAYLVPVRAVQNDHDGSWHVLGACSAV